ncbi:MAG: Methyl-accepting chemotaxis protein I [Candidatus Erwinia impunctatus]|nr:Methyl-accepting chemotaxis protein I [Culicoides impunctatus]
MIWLQKEGVQSERIGSMIEHAKEQLTAADRWFKEYQSGPMLDGFDQHLNQKLAESYQAYSGQLTQLVGIAAQRDMAGLFGLNVAPAHQRMEQDYNAWRAEVNTLARLSSVKSKQAYSNMQWLLGGILLLLICFILLCWKVLSKVLIQPLNLALKHIKTIESGDLTQRVVFDTRARNEMAQLLSGLSGMQQSLATTVGNVRSGTDIIAAGVSEIASGNDDLSSRTEQQASSLEETAASMEQITATVKKNADNSHEAARLALSAAENAEKGGTIVDGVIKSIFGLEKSSRKIS